MTSNANAPPTSPTEHAPVLVVHGVGDFAGGALIDEVSQHWGAGSEQGARPLRRQTLFVGGHRYTELECCQDTQNPASAGNCKTRFLEVNWSDVRRTTATLWGLLKNFALVMLTLTRLGALGVQGSVQLQQPLVTRVAVLVLVETCLVWAALLPALSALLWRLPQASRLGVALAVGAGLVYLASWVWRWSRPMALGAVGFAAFTLWAGFTACVIPPCAGGFCGRDAVTFWAGRLHSGFLLAAGCVLAVAMLEIFWQGWRSPKRRARGHWIQSFARVACLWLPAVMLSAVQPLTVAAVLLTFEPTALDAWGSAFDSGLLFAPAQGYTAAVFVLAVLVATLVVGALQYLSVRHWGRNQAALAFAGLAGAAVLAAHWARSTADAQCAACFQPALLDVLALVAVASAWVGYWVFRQRRSLHALGEAWHPAGKYARFWASTLLRLAPLGLLAALSYLLLSAWDYTPPPACTPNSGSDCLTASDYILRAAKFALLALPLAAKPAAALIDALGDVFYWFVPSQALNTRAETRSRFDVALSHLLRGSGAPHVVVLAHSQGSVIAADALCDLARTYTGERASASAHPAMPTPTPTPASLAPLAAHLRESGQRITLVTVGSPLSSLYRSFFGVTIGREFLELCRSEPQRFAWVNVCRAADYIGSRVVLAGVRNYLLATPGDHTGYWRDPVLLQWLSRYAAGQGVAQAAAFEGSAALVPLGGHLAHRATSDTGRHNTGHA